MSFGLHKGRKHAPSPVFCQLCTAPSWISSKHWPTHCWSPHPASYPGKLRASLWWSSLFLARNPLTRVIPGAPKGWCSVRQNLRFVSGPQPALAPKIRLFISARSWYSPKDPETCVSKEKTIKLEPKFREVCVQAKPVIRGLGFLFYLK